MTRDRSVGSVEPISDDELLEYLKGLLISVRQMTGRTDYRVLHHMVGMAIYEVDAIRLDRRERPVEEISGPLLQKMAAGR